MGTRKANPRTGGKMKKITAIFGNPEGAIIDAIESAYKDNKKIVRLGIPLRIQKQIAQHNVERSDRLKQIFGIKVVTAKTMQITTEFYPSILLGPKSL